MKLPASLRNIVTKLMTTYFRYVLLAVAAVVLGIGYTTVIAPNIKTVRLTGFLELRRETENLKRANMYYAQVSDMVSKYQDAVGKRQDVSTIILPKQPELDKLFLILQEVARASNVSVDSIAIIKGSSVTTSTTSAQQKSATTKSGSNKNAASTTGDTLRVLDINFGVTGVLDYDSYKQTLAALEQSMRILDVSGIAYKPTGLDQQGASLSTTTTMFQIRAYYLESAS